MADTKQSTKDDCKKHEGHTHRHGPECGHKSVKHGDHIDYLHDGHHHRVHGDHVDECKGPR